MSAFDPKISSARGLTFALLVLAASSGQARESMEILCVDSAGWTNEGSVAAFDTVRGIGFLDPETDLKDGNLALYFQFVDCESGDFLKTPVFEAGSVDKEFVGKMFRSSEQLKLLDERDTPTTIEAIEEILAAEALPFNVGTAAVDECICQSEGDS